VLTTKSYGDGACGNPVVAGSGHRVAFVATGNNMVGVPSNPDGSFELVVMDADGSDKRFLSDIIPSFLETPDVSADGETIVFSQALGYVAPDTYRGTEIFRMDRDGGNVVQITDENSAWSPSLTLDGSKITYIARTGLFTIGTDGTGRLQLIEVGLQDHPHFAGDGSLIVFDSTDDTTGANPDGSRELFSILPDGTGLAQLTDGPTGTTSEQARLDGTGTWIVYRSTANPVGENSDGSPEAFLMRSDGSEIRQLSHMPPGGAAGGG
jgi:Tol biopolymer transport system component